MRSAMTFHRSTHSKAISAAIGAVALVATSAAMAQQVKPAAAPTTAAAPKAEKDAGASRTAGSENAALRQRVEQLEEQLIDLQVVIGTLESLAKPPPGQGGAGPAPADAQRIQALEGQLKALGQQIEQLGEKVRGAGEPTKRSEAVPTMQPPSGTAQVGTGPPSPARHDTATEGSATVTSSQPGAAGAGQAPRYDVAPGTALPEIGSEAVAAPTPGGPAGPDIAAVEPPLGSDDPKHDYETAYSHIIQRDYPAAQAGFAAFMKRHPKDALVPNALYWLGETHYQQRNFADAAEAFDLVTKIYAGSPKAADSQLKRALSYSALGKNNEACAALSELETKFETAPAYVKTRAGSERRRLGCSG